MSIETSRLGNPTGPLATDHHHGQDRDAEVAQDLLNRLGVWCGYQGAHSHAGHPLHHHHDLRCLVEAGRRQVEPERDKALRRLEVAKDGLEIARATVREQHRRIDDLERVKASWQRLSVFLQQFPAVGPWRCVWDAWREHERDEETSKRESKGEH